MLTKNGKLGSIALLFLLSVSLFGMLLAIVFVVNPTITHDNLIWRKPAVGLALGVVCLLGIFAVLYPGSCAGIIHFKDREKNVHTFSESSVKVLRGHHATCKLYFPHVMQIGNKVFCATCSGLLVGAIIVLIGISLFFFGNLTIGDSFVPVIFGVGGVAVGLLYPVVPSRFQNSYQRFFAGVLLAVCSFLIIAGVEEAARNFVVDFLFVALSLVWLTSKILLSQWEHRRICARCSLNSCTNESNN